MSYKKGGSSLDNMKKKKKCPFLSAKITHIDYKDVETLTKYITERGKILPRRVTGVSSIMHKRLARAIEKARFMALLPYVACD